MATKFYKLPYPELKIDSTISKLLRSVRNDYRLDQALSIASSLPSHLGI